MPVKTKDENKSERFVIISYLIYIIIWKAMVLGGFFYIVFVLGNSGWWMLLALIMSESTYKPESWKMLLTNNGIAYTEEYKETTSL